MEENLKRPGVGVSVFVLCPDHKDVRILIGERKGAHGEGTWALPGGHIEYGETPKEACKREVMEECNIEICDINPVPSCPYTNDVFEKEGKHYITLFFFATAKDISSLKANDDSCDKWEFKPIEEILDIEDKYLFKPLFSILKDEELLINLINYKDFDF